MLHILTCQRLADRAKDAHLLFGQRLLSAFCDDSLHWYGIVLLEITALDLALKNVLYFSLQRRLPLVELFPEAVADLDHLAAEVLHLDFPNSAAQIRRLDPKRRRASCDKYW